MNCHRERFVIANEVSRLLRSLWSLAMTTILFPAVLIAEPLNMTISGKAAEKLPLETLVASPDIPTADTLSLSLDAGASAAGDELEPMSVAKAVLDMKPTQLPMPNLSAIPDAPYIVQAVPMELERQRDNKLRRNEKHIRFTNWEFHVVDELNNTVHHQSGGGFPPQPLTWDGTQDGQFILKPNLAYVSTLKLMAHGEPDRTIVGESVRFLAFLRQAGDDTVIEIGERIYKQEEAQFSMESKIYLDDLANRLSHNMIFYQESSKSEWQVILREPNSQSILASARKKLWKGTLEKMLGKTLPDKNFAVKESGSDESSISIIFPRSKPPLTDVALRGTAKANLDPIADDMKSIAKISENKKTIFVDLRHDRIFNPGSAYIKDSALPLVMQAIDQTKTRMKTMEGKEKKKLLLRSYTQKLPGDKYDAEEDPKLTATRSKVLFMLFARETLSEK